MVKTSTIIGKYLFYIKYIGVEVFERGLFFKKYFLRCFGNYLPGIASTIGMAMNEIIDTRRPLYTGRLVSIFSVFNWLTNANVVRTVSVQILQQRFPFCYFPPI